MLMELCKTCCNEKCFCRNCIPTQMPNCGNGCGYDEKATTCYAYKKTTCYVYKKEDVTCIKSPDAIFDESLLSI